MALQITSRKFLSTAGVDFFRIVNQARKPLRRNARRRGLCIFFTPFFTFKGEITSKQNTC